MKPVTCTGGLGRGVVENDGGLEDRGWGAARAGERGESGGLREADGNDLASRFENVTRLERPGDLGAALSMALDAIVGFDPDDAIPVKRGGRAVLVGRDESFGARSGRRGIEEIREKRVVVLRARAGEKRRDQDPGRRNTETPQAVHRRTRVRLPRREIKSRGRSG